MNGAVRFSGTILVTPSGENARLRGNCSCSSVCFASVLPLTEVLQEIRRDITRKIWSFFLRILRSRCRETAAWQAPDRFEQKGTKRTGY